tara:strand:+ start:1050 stop:2639 length:1590 start_codon:yes stop_codon:yes gene_type:complete
MINEIKKNLLLKFHYYFFAIIILISFFGTVWQSQFTFDPLHWGFSLQTAIDIIENKTPYKEIFIQYGILNPFFHSLILKITNGNILSLMVLTSAFYSLGMINLFFVTKKIININFALYLLITIFFIHPIAIYPWYLYLSFFLISFGVLLFLQNKIQYFFLSGFFFGLGYLSHENYFYIFLIIFILNFILSYKIFFKPTDKVIFKKLILFFFGFLLPAFFFVIFLNYKNIFFDWLKILNLNNVYLSSRDTNFVFIFLDSIHYLAKISIIDFLKKPYYFIFLVILITNFIYIIFYLLKPKTKFSNLYIFNISLLCCGLYLNTIHAPDNVFRYSTGFIIGLISVFFIISKTKKKFIKNIFILFIVCSSFSSLQFYKSDTNPFFPAITDYKKFYSKELITFKSMRWHSKVHKHYLEIHKISKKIKKNCNQTYFVNFTQDGFGYITLSNYFNSYQFISLYKFDYKILEDLFKYFNIDLLKQTYKKIEDENVVIYLNKNDLRRLKNINNYNVIELPYNYWLKNKILLKPVSCKID